MTYREPDQELEESTDRVMVWGAGLLLLMAAVFPLYLLVEPSNRANALDEQLTSLAQQGEELFDQSCASCHGISGSGGTAPALNSQQFLQAASDGQIELLIAVGVPGSQMSAYSQDFGGPMTSEQIRAITIYLRNLEDTAPDRPDWRDMVGG